MGSSRQSLVALVVCGWLVIQSGVVYGCPFCDSATGEQVYSGIFNADFFSNAAATLWPFPVLLGIVAVIYFGPPPWYVRVRRPERETIDPADVEGGG